MKGWTSGMMPCSTGFLQSLTILGAFRRVSNLKMKGNFLVTSLLICISWWWTLLSGWKVRTNFPLEAMTSPSGSSHNGLGWKIGLPPLKRSDQWTVKSNEDSCGLKSVRMDRYTDRCCAGDQSHVDATVPAVDSWQLLTELQGWPGCRNTLQNIMLHILVDPSVLRPTSEVRGISTGELE